MSETPTEVPWQRLSPEALQRLIEEFVTRDGTDYGATERTLEQKVAAVRRLLERGEAVIVFDPGSGTCTVAPREATT